MSNMIKQAVDDLQVWLALHDKEEYQLSDIQIFQIWERACDLSEKVNDKVRLGDALEVVRAILKAAGKS